MFLGLNGKLAFATKFEFSNGWAISIGALPCGHIEYVICPAYVFHEEFYDGTKSEVLARMKKVSDDARDHNDEVLHYDGTDEQIISIIGEVALRPNYEGVNVADEMLAKVMRK